MKFKVGDRVLISPESRIYHHQNKDNQGNEYAGTVTRASSKGSGGMFSNFTYHVRWDKGAHSEGAYYNDKDLVAIAKNNKEAAKLLSKEF
jgi:hypothetical protein